MRQSGFTLVELSIVLVIIGLIVGGILAGQEMVRASELNRVVSDKDRLVAAYNTFRGKYNAVPGDMRNATDYWGSATTCPNGSRSGTQTCNGNGDGVIGGTFDCSDTNFTESALAMQHLALSGLLPGTFTGFSVPGTPASYCAAQVGTNAPVTSIQGATFMFYGQTTANASYFNVIPRRAIFFGGTNTDTDIPAYPAFKVAEAQGMDTKLDDGRPGTGMLVTPTSAAAYAPSCATTSDPATAAYNTASNTSLQCSFLFLVR